MIATTCTLTGKALAEEAKRLDISGRSKMTAAELRARITERYRAKIVAEYRAACTEYATHQTPGAAKRLAVADSAREAAGIRSVDIPTPDGCPDGCPDTLSQVTDNTPGEVEREACPVTGLADCRDVWYCELHYMSAPLQLPPVPFRARNGKRKLSRTRIHRRTRAI